MCDLGNMTIAGLLATLRRAGDKEHNDMVDQVERELQRRAEAAMKAVQRALGRRQ